MARDYSSRRNHPPGSSGPRKTAKRTRPAATSVRSKARTGSKKNGHRHKNNAPPARAGAPGCIWLVCGLLVAIVAGSIYYIASRPAGHGPESVRLDLPGQSRRTESDTAASNPRPESPNGPAENQPEPRFSFYKMLPNYKVDVPASRQPVTAPTQAPHEAEPAADTPTPTQSSPSSAASGPQSAPATRSGPNGDRSNAASGGYVIQAGAFSTHDDADHRKARLALLGVTADIVDVRTSSGKTVYRVQSSTLSTSAKARSLAQRLKSHGIETMIRHAD